MRRGLLLLAGFGCAGGLAAAEFPAAPANHIYDPDFLLTKELTTSLGKTLVEFDKKSDATIYLAVFTETPCLLEETAQELNQAWNQSGYGVVVTFVPGSRAARVLTSPQLSLLENADELTALFRDAAQPGLARGDYSSAAASGTEALMKRLRDLDARLAPPPAAPWRPSRGEILVILASVAVVGLAFLWVAVRVWRTANLFDDRYIFPKAPGPAALRFGGRRGGGRMATIDFRAPLKAKDV